MLPLPLQWFKYSLYVAVPLVFGYVLGRIPAFWERAAEIVRALNTSAYASSCRI